MQRIYRQVPNYDQLSERLVPSTLVPLIRTAHPRLFSPLPGTRCVILGMQDAPKGAWTTKAACPAWEYRLCSSCC